MLDSIDWQQTISNLVRVTLAFVLVLPAAYNRESKTQIMGLRTFPLVSVGACAYVLIGLSFMGPEHADARARVMQGLLSGLGFLGAGAILKGEDGVRGTASAATIWVTGAVGTAVAFGVWELAVILSAVNWAVLSFLSSAKDVVKENGEDSPE